MGHNGQFDQQAMVLRKTDGGRGRMKPTNSERTIADVGRLIRNEKTYFETFWSAYPRKVGKRKAEEAWNRTDAHPEDIIKGLKVSVQNWISEGVEPRFIPHASTWLNQGRWEDGLTVDVAALAQTPYTEFTDDDWRVYLSGEPSEYSKQYMPDHIREEFGLGLRVVK
jgi:hypothetical protein